MDFKESINESYDVEYQEECETGEGCLLINDLDNKKLHKFYIEDIKKLRRFLNRLEGFGIRIETRS